MEADLSLSSTHVTHMGVVQEEWRRGKLLTIRGNGVGEREGEQREGELA